MANQRPIRRPPIPRWRRGRRRPVRWIDAASSRTLSAPCTTSGFDLLCDPSPPAVLLYGDADWEWADRSEVRIDRLVGSASWRSASVYPADTGFPVGEPVPWIVRIGVLAVEDTDTTYPVLDLFDPEVLEEYQWMWLYSSTGNHSYNFTSAAEALSQLNQWDNIPMDIRTRRSLGKKDSVLLYAQTSLLSSVSTAGTNYLMPRLSWQLRSIIRS